MSVVKDTPQALVYEFVKGKPIYYQAYLNGEAQLEEVMGSRKLQSFLVVELIFWLKTHFGNSYYLFTNELGLQFEENSWRVADIAMMTKSKAPGLNLDDKYLELPPDLVIEIDTKADLAEIQNPLGYYQEKTQDLLDFGVGQVIWIFTDTQKVLTAESNKRWEIAPWGEDISVLAEHVLNVGALIP